MALCSKLCPAATLQPVSEAVASGKPSSVAEVLSLAYARTHTCFFFFGPQQAGEEEARLSSKYRYRLSASPPSKLGAESLYVMSGKNRQQ